MDLQNAETPFPSSARSSRTPSLEQWEMIREFVLRHWYEGDETLQSVIDHLRISYGFRVTTKTLKNKLTQWSLRKNLTYDDARNLLKAFHYIQNSERPDIVLIRGKVETLERIQRHVRRGGKVCADNGQDIMADAAHCLSKIIIISQHPVLQPQCALIVLGKLEALLRELQRLVIGAKENSLCVPDDDHIRWLTSSVEATRMEQGFQNSIWEGARAFEEGDVDWAGLCWRSASLRLESLLWEPDVDIWMSYIRCCIRLDRFGLANVGKHLHQKLRSWRDFLPTLAPHRALVFALADIEFDDIISGGLFLLEAQLRQFELLWPDHSNAHVIQRLHLVEERLHQNCHEQEYDFPTDDAFDTTVSKKELREYINTQINHISARSLAEDHQTAENLTTACILNLEARANHLEVDPLVHMMIPRMYNILGGIQLSQHCYEKAQESYTRSVILDQDFAARYNEHANGPFRLHRTLTLLLWLEKQELRPQIAPAYDLKTSISVIERDLAVEVGRAENKRVRLGNSRKVAHGPKKTGQRELGTRIKPFRSPQVAFDRDKTPINRTCGGVYQRGKSYGPKPPRPVAPWG